jgi:hypothetical protein
MKLTPKIARLALGSVAIALLFCVGIARPQEALPPPPAQRAFTGAGPGAEEMGFIGFEAGIAGKTVTGAPFTATVTTQVSRTLADNSINRTVTGSIARDSKGRVRRDMTAPAMALLGAGAGTPPKAVMISDPVAGTNYILHPDEKTAEQLPARRWRANGPRRFGHARQGQADVVKTDLGTETINGVNAQGTRVTRTIPAGQIGNEKPIVIVTERWYSPELQTYVMTKRIDPLMGNVTFQLTNIQLQEPDPTLFQVPSDYSVTQGPRPGARSRNRANAPQDQQP